MTARPPGRPILRTALKARLVAAAVAAATLADSGAETAAETAEEGEGEALCGKITEGRCSFLHSFLGPDTATECKAIPGVPPRVRLPFRGVHARHLLSSPVSRETPPFFRPLPASGADRSTPWTTSHTLSLRRSVGRTKACLVVTVTDVKLSMQY